MAIVSRLRRPDPTKEQPATQQIRPVGIFRRRNRDTKSQTLAFFLIFKPRKGTFVAAPLAGDGRDGVKGGCAAMLGLHRLVTQI
jgi:hypothetical protein